MIHNKVSKENLKKHWNNTIKLQEKNVWGGGVAKFNTDLHYELSYCGAFFWKK